MALDTVYEAIEKPVRYSGILAEIIIEPVTPKMREDSAENRAFHRKVPGAQEVWRKRRTGQRG